MAVKHVCTSVFSHILCRPLLAGWCTHGGETQGQQSAKISLGQGWLDSSFEECASVPFVCDVQVGNKLEQTGNAFQVRGELANAGSSASGKVLWFVASWKHCFMLHVLCMLPSLYCHLAPLILRSICCASFHWKLREVDDLKEALSSETFSSTCFEFVLLDLSAIGLEAIKKKAELSIVSFVMDIYSQKESLPLLSTYHRTD